MDCFIYGWNFFFEEIEEGSTYYYLLFLSFTERNKEHPLFKSTFINPFYVGELCGFSREKTERIYSLLKSCGFIEEKKVDGILKEELQEYFQRNSIPFEIKDCKTIYKFRNLDYKLRNRYIFYHFKESKSFKEFKQKYRGNSIYIDYFKFITEQEVSKKNTKQTKKIKVYGKTYTVPVSHYSSNFKKVLQQIENDFYIPITKVFELYEIDMNISKYFHRILDLLNTYGIEFIRKGFEIFIQKSKDKKFRNERKNYFLSSLKKFIEINIQEDNEEKNNEMFVTEVLEVNRNITNPKTRFERYVYKCPNCGNAVYYKEGYCIKCQTKLSWMKF